MKLHRKLALLIALLPFGAMGQGTLDNPLLDDHDPLLPLERLHGPVERTEIHHPIDGTLLQTTWYDAQGRPERRYIPRILQSTYWGWVDAAGHGEHERHPYQIPASPDDLTPYEYTYTYTYNSFGQLEEVVCIAATGSREDERVYRKQVRFEYDQAGLPAAIEVHYRLADGQTASRRIVPLRRLIATGQTELELPHGWDGVWDGTTLWWGDPNASNVLTIIGMRNARLYYYGGEEFRRTLDNGYYAYSVNFDLRGRPIESWESTGMSINHPLPNFDYLYLNDIHRNWITISCRPARWHEQTRREWRQQRQHPRSLFQRAIFYRDQAKK